MFCASRQGACWPRLSCRFGRTDLGGTSSTTPSKIVGSTVKASRRCSLGLLFGLGYVSLDLYCRQNGSRMEVCSTYGGFVAIAGLGTVYFRTDLSSATPFTMALARLLAGIQKVVMRLVDVDIVNYFDADHEKK